MDNKEVKSAIDRIVVPKEKVFNAIDKGLKISGQSRKTKKKKVLAGLVAAAALLGMTFASGFINPVMKEVLANVPLIGGIFQDFDDSMGEELAIQGAVSEFNQSLTKNGVTVKLTSAYFDGNVVSITGFVDESVEKGLNEEGEVSFDVNFEHNKGDNDPWLAGSMIAIRKVDGGYNFQFKMDYPYKTIKENFILPVTIHYINGIKGEWNFNIPIQQDKYRTLAIKQDKSYPEVGIKISVNEILTAKASSSIIYEIEQEYKDDDVIFMKAIDDKGNVYGFGNAKMISELKKEDGHFSIIRRGMTKLKADSSLLTFYPQLTVRDPKVQQRLDKKSFILKSQRSNLALQVNYITNDGENLVIDYRLLGLSKELSKNRLDEFAHNLGFAFMLVDHKYLGKINPENPFGPENHSISHNKVKIIDAKTAHFQSAFNLDGEENIKNFKLEKMILQFDFSRFVAVKELTPFTVDLRKENK